MPQDLLADFGMEVVKGTWICFAVFPYRVAKEDGRQLR